MRFSTALALCVAFLMTGSLTAQTVQANYPLTVDLLDTTGTYGPVALTGNAGPAPAPPTAGGVCHNGNYWFSGGPGQDIRSPEITSLDATDFEIDVDFNITSLGGNMPILMMGNGWRWIGLYVDAAGTIGAKHNNSNLTWSTTTVSAGNWHTAKLKFELGVLQIVLDGAQIHTNISVGPLNTGNDLCFTTNDFSTGSAYNGCIRNVTLSNDTTVAGGNYQVNSPASSMNVGGQPNGGAFAYMSASQQVGLTLSVALASTNTGFPWDIGQTASAPIPGVGTPGGQRINLDLTDPTFTSLFGLSFSTSSFANTTLGLSSIAPLAISGQLAVADPLGPDGIALSGASHATFVTCDAVQNFDAPTAYPGTPGVYPNCWTDGGGFRPWYIHTGGTPSGSTGPTGDNTTGAGNYAYCETSGGATGADYILHGPQQMPTGGGVTFAYHMYGATMGTLELQELQGGTWTQVWTISGDQGQMWHTTAPILLMTNPTNIRFHYVKGSSFTGDCSIDDVTIL